MPPLPPTQSQGWRRWGLIIAATALTAGCAPNGDFGQVRPYLVRDDIHDWVANDAIAGKPTFTSRFELTDDERQLRDLAYPLIEPPYDRQQWYSVLGEYGVIGADHRTGFDRTAYATRLFTSRYRSPAARYAQLTDDIHNDTVRLPQFFETAARVLDVDYKRRQSFAYIPDMSAPEYKNAKRRMHENGLIVAWVYASLDQRVASYRFALERLVIMTPSSQAVDVERHLNELKARIARYHRPAPTGYQLERSLGLSGSL